MNDAMNYCVHCQRRTVVITRDQDGCLVSCKSCGRAWSYRSSSLSDEILLNNYAAQGPALRWVAGLHDSPRGGASSNSM